MIASYNKPEIVIPNDAIGIDKAIAEIQTKFGALTWLSYVFGKCNVQHDWLKAGMQNKGTKTLEYVYPQIYSKTSEPYNLMMNDNLKSYCFFVAHDPGDFVDYNFMSSQSFVKRKVSIIFWFNCEKIEPGSKQPFNAKLIAEVVKCLQFYSYFEFDQVFESYSRVFDGFTLMDSHVQYMKFPYNAFRIDGFITFPLLNENC